MYAEAAKIYGKNKSHMCEIVKEKGTHVIFAASQTATVAATVGDKWVPS